MGQPIWGLEVVKGREVGRVYPIGPGPTTLGNALDGVPGIDLGPQEAASPRRMAARQARLDCAAGGLTLLDLDSPGGTFVNRQRLLGGQARRLQDGDVVQLGGVQLKVVAVAPSATPVPPHPTSPARPASSTGAALGRGLAVPYRLANGATCQNWDDFLTASARSWSALRDELTSGRLGAFLAAQGRADLLPRAAGPGQTDDDRLDDWLGRLPATRPARAEMDVHPTLLKIKAIGAGGVSRQNVRVTNTGYRLLASTVRIEPEGAGWVRLPPSYLAGPFKTPEETVIPVEVTIPPDLDSPLVTGLWIEGIGGKARVEIRVEPAAPLDPFPVAEAARLDHGPTAWERLRALPPRRRILGLALAALALRAAVMLGDALARSLAAVGEVERPTLSGAALVLGGVCSVAAALGASRRGEARDVPAAAFAGGLGGILLAAVAVAACRAVEPLLGEAAGSFLVAGPLWFGIGALAGWAVGRAGSVFATPPGLAEHAP